MILVDTNLLLHGYDASSDRHDAARRWLELALSGRDPVRLTWTTLIGFLRISTHARILQAPLSIEEAVSVANSWFAQPAFGIIEPGERHWLILSDLLQESQSRGNLVPDAHLAAIAIEYGATLYTADRDFTRFGGLSFKNPLES